MAEGSLGEFSVGAFLDRKKFDTQLKGMEAEVGQAAQRLGQKLQVGGGGLGGFLKGLGSESREMGLGGRNSIFSAVRGGGALIGVHETARAINRVTESFAKVREHLDTGGSKVQAFAMVIADAIPVVGDLAKAFRGAYDSIYENFTDAGKAEKKAREDKERRQDLIDKLAERGIRSNDIVQAVEAETREAKRRVRAAQATTDAEREMIDAENERARSLEELEKEVREKRPKVVGDQVERFDNAVRERIDAINKEFEATKFGKKKEKVKAAFRNLEDLWRDVQEGVLEGGGRGFAGSSMRRGTDAENPLVQATRGSAGGGPVDVKMAGTVKMIEYLGKIYNAVKSGIPGRFAQ